MDQPVYTVFIPVGSFMHQEFFTLIPWREFRRIKHMEQYMSIDPEQIEEEVFKKYILPRNKYSDLSIENLNAGIVTTVSKIILQLSDSNTYDENPIEKITYDLNVKRHYARAQVDLQILSTICSVFKSYTFEDLEKLSFDKILQLFACAEHYLLQTGQIVEPFNIGDPRLAQAEEAKEIKAPAKKVESIEASEGIEDDILAITKQLEIIKKESKEKEKIKEKPLEVVVKDRGVLDEAWMLKPTPVNPNHPNREILEERERKRVDAINRARAVGRSIRNEYVAPEQNSVNVGGVDVGLTGIDYSAGFKPDDFEGLPTLTDDEVNALAAQSELFPAGWEFMKGRLESEIENKEKLLNDRIKEEVGNKKLSLRDRKLLKQKLEEEKKGK